jgi:GNAT superfamily N-acetyltransferase
VELARPAGARDHPACARLLGEVLSLATRMRGGAALVGRSTTQELLDRWTGPGAHLVVGEFEGVVVGLLGATAAPAEAGSPRRGLIECCYVEAGARGVGVGSALLQAAVDWCRSRECAEVDAVALPGDRSTKQRLEGAGFTARLLTLSRRLD